MTNARISGGDTTFIYIYTYTYIYLYIYTYIHTYIHIIRRRHHLVEDYIVDVISAAAARITQIHGLHWGRPQGEDFGAAALHPNVEVYKDVKLPAVYLGCGCVERGV